MPDPVYIGHVRFGAGAGCPCGSGSKRIVYRKHHHKFGASSNGRFIYFYQPITAFLVMDGSGWTESELNVTRTINRLTGMADGSWELPSGVWDHLDSYDADTSVWQFAWDPDQFGTVDFSSEYTLATLLADLSDVVTEPTLAIGYVPSEETWLAGRAESINPWSESFVIGSTPADGRFVMQFEQLGSGIVDTGGLREVVLYSTFWRAEFAERQRLLTPFIGHFSLQAGYEIEQLPGFGSTTTVYGDRRYFYLDSGALDLMSPEIDSTLAATATYRFRSWEHLRIGDMPPPGTDPTHVSGVGGAGGGC